MEQILLTSSPLQSASTGRREVDDMPEVREGK